MVEGAVYCQATITWRATFPAYGGYKVKVLSLFDGMSCGQIALNRIGIKPDCYYAAEVDKHAIKVTKANYPNTVQLGDVTQWREWPINWASIDLLMGGSPCQGFSYAGNQLAFDDPRSKLFFVYVDILNHIRSVNPNIKFMLENVKMKKEFLEVISNHLGVKPVLINSALLSAQNRRRYYWVNWVVEQPEDKGVVLSDVLESGDFAMTVMSEKFTRRNASILRDDFTGKAKNLSSMEYVKNGRQGDYIKVKGPGLRYRKLTPIECERLQTVTDNYTNYVSNTQRYRMLGNGWTVDVIAHILRATFPAYGS